MINQDKLYAALRVMGKKHLKPLYRDYWTPEHPTTGYCYVVAEVAYHYLAPKGSKPYVMHTGERETHWFLRAPNGVVIDLTADQFDTLPDYKQGRRANFLTPKPSKRPKILAEVLGVCPPPLTMERRCRDENFRLHREVA